MKIVMGIFNTSFPLFFAHQVNGSAMLDPEVLELRRQIEKQATEAGVTHRNLSDLRSKNAELEEQLIQLNKELHQSQEIAKALEIDLKENVAQKGDQEERIATLEKRWGIGLMTRFLAGFFFPFLLLFLLPQIPQLPT